MEDSLLFDAKFVLPTQQIRYMISNHFDLLKPMIESVVKEALTELNSPEKLEEFKESAKESVIKYIDKSIKCIINDCIESYAYEKKEEYKRIVLEFINTYENTKNN